MPHCILGHKLPGHGQTNDLLKGHSVCMGDFYPLASIQKAEFRAQSEQWEWLQPNWASRGEKGGAGLSVNGFVHMKHARLSLRKI